MLKVLTDVNGRRPATCFQRCTESSDCLGHSPMPEICLGKLVHAVLPDVTFSCKNALNQT